MTSPFPSELPLFVLIAETGSFSATGRKAGLAASSVARRLDALEKELGVRLVNRSTRRLGLTDAGLELLDRARAIISHLDEARTAVVGRDRGPSGLLRVTASFGFGRRHVAPALGEFARLYPALNVELRLEDGFADLIEQGVDLAIRIGRLPDSNLRQVRLAGVRRVACASPGYVGRRGVPQTPEELQDHDCIMVGGGVGLEGAWRFGSGRTPRLTPRISVNSPEGVAAAAVGGAGIAHLPTWMVAEELRLGRLVELLSTFEAPPDRRNGLHLVWPKNEPAKTRAFAEFMKGRVGSPPYWDRA